MWVHIRSVLQGAPDDNPQYTLQPLYNTVRYNTVMDITQFKDGSQKCIDYIEKIFNIIYTFFFRYNMVV